MSHLPPETLQNIFDKLISECCSTLFRCLLVNRYWCANAVLIIWKEPFKYEYSSNKFLKFCVRLLPFNVRERLVNSNVLPPLCLKAVTVPYFDYFSFIKHINLPDLWLSLEEWIIHHNLKNQYFVMDYDVQVEQQLKVYKELIKHVVDRSESVIYNINLEDCNYTSVSVPFLFDLSDVIPKGSHLEVLQCFTWWPEEIFEDFSKIFSRVGMLILHCKEDNEGLANFLKVSKGYQMLRIKSTITTTPLISNALKLNARSLEYLEVNAGGSISLEIFSECDNLEHLIVTKDDNYFHPNVFDEMMLEGVYDEDDDENDDDVDNNDEEERVLSYNYNKPYDFGELSSSASFKNLRKLSLKDYRKINFKDTAKIISTTNFHLTTLCLLWKEESDPENFSLLISTIIAYGPKLKELEIIFNENSASKILSLLCSCDMLKNLCLKNTKDLNIDMWMQNLGQVIPKTLKTLNLQNYFTFTLESLENFLFECERNSINGLRFNIQDGGYWLEKEYIKILNDSVEKGILDASSKTSWMDPREFMEQVLLALEETITNHI